jgi:hypothetical protein
MKRKILDVLLFGLFAFVIAMTLFIFATIDASEIWSSDYEKVLEIGNNCPELLPFIRKICEDEKITRNEFQDLRNLIPGIQKERAMKEFK